MANPTIEYFLKLYEQGQRFVVFDVETVGHGNATTIVEIGAIEAGVAFGKVYQTFNKILQFRPHSWSPFHFELQIHKIPPHVIENGEDRKNVLQEFLNFIQDAVLICHTSFDIRAMRTNLTQIAELAYALEWPHWHTYIDSCRLARLMMPSLGKYSLSNLAKHFGIQNPESHRGLGDAYTTKRVLAKLLQQYRITQAMSQDKPG